MFYYRDDWLSLVDFKLCDAANKDYRYVDNLGNDITHIYSYNKVMSIEDMEGISELLNKSNWLVLAWYFGPEATAKFGLKNFEILERLPMHSTGKENFTVFVYYKTKKLQSKSEPKTTSRAPVEKLVDASESKDTLSVASGKKRRRSSTREQV